MTFLTGKSGHFVGHMLVATGVVAVVCGFAIVGVEIVHQWIGVHRAIPSNYVAGGVFVLGGAALVQTGSVKATLDILIAIIPIIGTARKGGSRSYDKLLDKPGESEISTDELELPPSRR
jgi:hypothetical protein